MNLRSPGTLAGLTGGGDVPFGRSARPLGAGSAMIFLAAMVLAASISTIDGLILADETAQPPARTARDAQAPATQSPESTWPPKNIPPLYTAPALPGEGVWEAKDMPMASENPAPVVKTMYRPSVEFPNAVTYMLGLDMRRLSMRVYPGTSEPGGSATASRMEGELQRNLVAITNGLWKIRHAGKGGIIVQGEEVRKLAPGLATLVVYKDGKVDILEWKEDMDLSKVQDAKQLKHLIVKDGKVVTTIKKRGEMVDSEIGVGSLLNETQPVIPAKKDDPKSKPTLNITSGDNWFIATRSAFGIREDGNLVFAVGQHIGTKDLAKSLVLAGCVRAIHGDSNPGNALANLYYTDEAGNIVKKARLFAGQDRSTLQRYLDKTYPNDFYAFFRKAK